MSDFKAKMHQIQFRLGPAPDPAGGTYSAPTDRLAGCSLLLREERGRDGKEERKGDGRPTDFELATDLNLYTSYNELRTLLLIYPDLSIFNRNI